MSDRIDRIADWFARNPAADKIRQVAGLSIEAIANDIHIESLG
jgi:hypothetical protein